jgi:hypothetical protein
VNTVPPQWATFAQPDFISAVLNLFHQSFCGHLRPPTLGFDAELDSLLQNLPRRLFEAYAAQHVMQGFTASCPHIAHRM